MLGFKMNKEEYNKILSDYQAKIEYLNEEMNNFKRTNLPIVKEYIKQQKQQRREWFLEHFDKIWENRQKFKLGTPYASVIIDGIIITSFACPYYGGHEVKCVCYCSESGGGVSEVGEGFRYLKKTAAVAGEGIACSA